MDGSCSYYYGYRKYTKQFQLFIKNVQLLPYFPSVLLLKMLICTDSRIKKYLQPNTSRCRTQGFQHSANLLPFPFLLYSSPRPSFEIPLSLSLTLLTPISVIGLSVSPRNWFIFSLSAAINEVQIQWASFEPLVLSTSGERKVSLSFIQCE